MTFFLTEVPICAFRAQSSLVENWLKKIINLFVESFMFTTVNKASYEEKRSKFSKNQKNGLDITQWDVLYK